MLETVEPPASLFEKFLTDDIMRFICQESIRYAISEENHSFTIDTNTLKAVIAILLVSGYVDTCQGDQCTANTMKTPQHNGIIIIITKPIL